jgi:hypothetical protein
MGFANPMEYANIPWLLFLGLRITTLCGADRRDEGLTMFCDQADGTTSCPVSKQSQLLGYPSSAAFLNASSASCFIPFDR